MDKEIKYKRIVANDYLKQKIFEEGLREFTEIFKPKYSAEYLIEKWGDAEHVYEYYKKFYKYYEKIWNGEDLTDKTLFIFYYHCGYGDCILFARYIHILEKMAEKVIVEMPPEYLKDLYKYNFPNCEIIDYHEKPIRKKYDYTYHHELFLNLQKNLKTFPYSEGYLNADPKLIEKYSPLFKTNKKKVGILWSSYSKQRSVPKELVHIILENENCQFYSLNEGDPSPIVQEIHDKYNIVDLAEYIRNGGGHVLAAIMKNLDLVITIDTSALHLAGALGVKTYLMLDYASTWYWFNDYHTTPWYDSVKIFRQNYFDEWEDVVKRVADSLKAEFD